MTITAEPHRISPPLPQAARRSRRSRYMLAPVAFAAVNIVMFLLFFIWPGALGLLYSFTNYRGFGQADFVGFDNYHTLFSDPEFYAALRRTAVYVLLSVPLTYVLSLGVAVLLVSKFTRGKTLAKTVFFFPWLISPIVTGVIWRWLFGENFGFVNFVLGELGFSEVEWSSNGDLSLAIVIFATAWAATAFNMLLFIAALKNVPRSYYEASELDGAGGWQRFRYITLPAIAPTSFMVILLSTINSMKEFAMVQALNGGGPGTENRLIVQYIYETGFKQAKVGYASAVSMILMVVLMVIALIQMRVGRGRGAS